MYTYVEDWNEEVHGIFPIKSLRHKDKKCVVLSGPDGIYAGWEIRAEKTIGKDETSRLVPAIYRPISLIQPNEEYLASNVDRQDI